MHSPVARLLKQRTARSHARVEELVALLDADLSVERVRTVLCRFAGFWQGTERTLDDWAAGPATRDDAQRLRWTRRRRSEVLRADLLGLGLTVAELSVVPEAPAVFARVGTGEALGWLYVTEGSTLGGAVIDRALQAHPATTSLRLRSFTPYLEGPGPMWRAYHAELDTWIGTDEMRAERVVHAAEATFLALEAWLEPIAVKDVA